MIYIARAGNAVKVGFSNNLPQRLKMMQTGCPDKIELVRTFDGDEATERALHQWFRSHHIRGEWFSLSILDGLDQLDILDVVRRYQATSGIDREWIGHNRPGRGRPRGGIGERAYTVEVRSLDDWEAKRGRGRPALPAVERRRNMGLQVSQVEREQLERAAAAAGLGLSVFIRNSALQAAADIEKLPPSSRGGYNPQTGEFQ